MTFLSQQPKVRQEEYFNLLKVMGSLSNLYSDSLVPYLYYRGHENAFCKSFLADNLSRSDASADAGKKGVGIGLKTFISQKEWSSQKIAEFNNLSSTLSLFLEIFSFSSGLDNDEYFLSIAKSFFCSHSCLHFASI